MSYRPITDIWFLARAKLKEGKKFYGAYLGGFPERARALLGCSINDPVLHVCGGMSKYYPYKRGFGPNDKTMDLDPETKPDFLHDVRIPFPPGDYKIEVQNGLLYSTSEPLWKPKACLCDPPYSPEDAKHYKTGEENYPSPNLILKNCFDVLPVGGRVGIIHYIVPKAPKNSIFVACVGVACGFNNRIRVYSVFEKT